MPAQSNGKGKNGSKQAKKGAQQSNKENTDPIPGTGIIIPTDSEKPKTRDRARWTDHSDLLMLGELKAQERQGNQTDNAGFKSDAWTACAAVLAGTEVTSGGCAKTAKSCSTRWTSVCSLTLVFRSCSSQNIQLKGHYKIVKVLHNKSGWGWDSDAHHVVVEDDVWDDFVKVFPTFSCSFS